MTDACDLPNCYTGNSVYDSVWDDDDCQTLYDPYADPEEDPDQLCRSACRSGGWLNGDAHGGSYDSCISHFAAYCGCWGILPE